MGAEFIRGIIPAMVTPMTEDEELDERGLAHLIDHLIGQGVHGVFTLGTAGESWALSTEEKKQVFEFFLVCFLFVSYSQCFSIVFATFSVPGTGQHRARHPFKGVPI